MAIKTMQSINGFIASDPQLTFTNGKARFYARIGIRHYEPLEGGRFRDLEPTFHDLVQFGKSAERSIELLRRGDNFIAQGSVRTYTRDNDGVEEEAEQFVAKRIGHDLNLTNYTVQRKNAAAQQAPGHDTPAARAAAPTIQRQPQLPPPAPPAPPPQPDTITR
ncbi:single-stranded DNA-binding protein [Jiangella alkaliphila]|uniref:Single-stranded DNA-binding protein n=1 Tax=Jiangella alkaliphila TaxID=419479 RepID=A0A1H2H1W1_9ACTN|nr:single-stranded DNA-binding protein [Jiangella alkaliphila]SDU25877.1 Single-stranded DNA-binding protein [Jiangella alkaliphila]